VISAAPHCCIYSPSSDNVWLRQVAFLCPGQPYSHSKVAYQTHYANACVSVSVQHAAKYSTLSPHRKPIAPVFCCLLPEEACDELLLVGCHELTLHVMFYGYAVVHTCVNILTGVCCHSHMHMHRIHTEVSTLAAMAITS